MSKLYSSQQVNNLINTLATQIKSVTQSIDPDQIAMIGIHTGGSLIADLLHPLCNIQYPLGTLDISFYRDDFSRKGLHPEVKPSSLPFDVDDQHILLVDDVLHTGRTIRAAMNEIFDYGRPAGIHLIALVERSGRELPVQPDVCGYHLNLAPSQQIKLTGPDPLALEILEYSEDT
jgi:pyrimidine operon attenuation protein/uracil phosphoribosyltransferase